MERQAFLNQFPKSTYHEEKIPGTIRALYIVITACKNEKKLNVLDNILAKYVCLKEVRTNSWYFHGQLHMGESTYILNCQEMPEKLAKKIIEQSKQVLQDRINSEQKFRRKQQREYTN
jgi:hypothetical protein